jgi:hypothetical protein
METEGLTYVRCESTHFGQLVPFETQLFLNIKKMSLSRHVRLQVKPTPRAKASVRTQNRKRVSFFPNSDMTPIEQKKGGTIRRFTQDRPNGEAGRSSVFLQELE